MLWLPEPSLKYPHMENRTVHEHNTEFHCLWGTVAGPSCPQTLSVKYLFCILFYTPGTEIHNSSCRTLGLTPGNPSAPSRYTQSAMEWVNVRQNTVSCIAEENQLQKREAGFSTMEGFRGGTRAR